VICNCGQIVVIFWPSRQARRAQAPLGRTPSWGFESRTPFI
ncbi:hypothetical protein HMPREF0591_1849, partial [Mycobacterium parascrofulaceum ATCC BAA-614]